MTKYYSYDTGYALQYTSLSGIKSRIGLPLRISRELQTVSTAGYSRLADINPLRVWLLIVNNDDSEKVIVFFGDTTGVADLIVTPHGSVLINDDFRFCGSVDCCAAVSSASVFVMEASIQQ